MEENNKYYTPSIEEFHVGFECELRNFDNGEWRSYVFSLNQVCFDKDGNTKEHAVVFWIKHGEVRVKYLDTADIEECGFVLDETSVKYGNCFDFKKAPYVITVNKLTNTSVTIGKMVNSEYENNGNNYVLFTGTIKNKSELKRLMKQLEI